ncbi:hypothetical protein BBI17_008178 [Phytophthora kernoviae]|uniref:Protein kinase domain-containing protein n=2 Tax=Phytophthora kernoviae TaxID=325452 RepID=A0A3R7MT09_9STRA|nr:hypothetical protein BBI17_008178 [Phytophthora kernoviae]
MRPTLAFVLAGFMTIWLLCVGLLWHMHVNRTGALKGDAAAAKRTILPTFKPVLIVLCFVNSGFILFLVVTLTTGFYDASVPPLIFEVFYSGRQFMFVFVLVLMFQKSLSLPAIQRSVVISLVLSSYSMIYVHLTLTYGDKKLSFNELQVVHSPLMVPFVYAFVWPPSRATKRTIRELCAVTLIYFMLSVVYMLLLKSPKNSQIARPFLFMMLTWVALCPLVIWRVLKADTEYWRGMGQQACVLQHLFQRQNRLRERISSEGLHVLIEIHRKYVIDFAYLDIGRQLGVGTSSIVFQGILKAKSHVAVKAYTPSSCSESVVAAFSHEAATCSVLNHPNIVKFHGISVAPPTICLLFELCQGNLEDMLRDQARRQNNHPARQQMLISVGYMLDAARAVAYLHSFSPAFIHRDIKPSNFLVDAECNVKLTDLGESRCVNEGMLGPGLTEMAKMATLEEKGLAGDGGGDDDDDDDDELTFSPLGTTLSHIDSPGSNDLENGSAEYAAPEIIRGKGTLYSYGEAADVYSLGLTMWDILNPSADAHPGTVRDPSRVPDGVLHGSAILVSVLQQSKSSLLWRMPKKN